MPFVIIAMGILLVIAGVRGTERVLYGLIYDDVLGSGGFIWWLIAIGLVGVIGYNKKFQPVSIAFMSLILLALLLSTKGAFADLISQINTVQQAAKTNATETKQGTVSSVLNDIQSLTQSLSHGV